MASRKFTEPFSQSDVSFSVEGKLIYAVKSTMSMWSPVFETMFGGRFKESKAKVVELPEKRFTDILELVSVLHPPNKPVDENNYEILLPLAREYQMDGLIQRIDEYLTRVERPSFRQLFLAEEYSMVKAKQRCCEFLKRLSLRSMLCDEWFTELSAETRAEILLCKANKYLEMLDELKNMVNGERPQQNNATCSKTFSLQSHPTGTEFTCKDCALHMAKILARKLSKGDY